MIRIDKAPNSRESFIRLNYMSGKQDVDIRIYLPTIDDFGQEDKLSNEFIFSPTFAAMLMALKATPFEVREEKIKEILLNTIDASEKDQYVVLMSIDGVYKNGKYIETESRLVIPNDYVIDIAKKNKHIIFGASVHPYREAREMLSETRRCIDEGAVFFNWMPLIQQIDPEDERCIHFYISLAREGIPLLCHTFSEFTPQSANDKSFKYNDPRRLRKALDIGVKVIYSHCTSHGNGSMFPSDKGYFDQLIEMLRASDEEKWDLYADISAFCNPSGMMHLERIKREIEKGKISPERFLYGINFPLTIADVNIFKGPLSLDELLENIRKQGSLLKDDNNIQKRSLSDDIFSGKAGTV